MYFKYFKKNEYLTSTSSWYIFVVLGVLGQLYLTPTLMSSTTIKENVILLQDRYNAAQTVKGTRQLHRFVPQPLGKLLVYNTSLQASPPTEGIIAKTISLSRVQIEDNTLQIGSFVACTYDEKWWLGMVTQDSDKFGDHNINCMHLSGPGKQFH